MPSLPVPATPDELDPRWLTAALADGGLVGRGLLDVVVDTVGVERIGTDSGFLGSLARLHLSYREGQGPATLVAKMPTTDPGGREVGAMLGVWQREALFFADVASSVPARVPRCYYVGADPTAERWVLLLEDCGDVAGDQLAGASADQARAAIDELARYQAPWLGRSCPFPWMPGFHRHTIGGLQPAMEAALPRFADRFGARVPGRTVGWLERFVAQLPAWAEAQAEEPLTLVHADYRLDNLLFPPEERPVILDWQTALWGPGPMDLASFLGTSLTVDDRRDLEAELVDRYVGGLGASPRSPSVVEVRESYRSCLLWWMAIFANNLSRIDAQGGRAAATFDAMIVRTYTAADDHDAGEVLR